MKDRQISKKYVYLFVCGMILILILSIWKARYGFGGNDEAFFLSIPLRLCNGEKLFVNEWNLSQMTALVLFPVVKLYSILFKSTDAIALNFRYIYIAFNSLVTIIAYIYLKEYKLGAVVAALLYMLFVPVNLMALSYNTIGLACMFLCSVFMVTAQQHSVKMNMLLAGIVFAVSVLCQPLLAVVFLVMLITVIIYRIISGTRISQYVIPFLLGCVIVAVPVVCYLLFGVGVKNIINSLDGLFSDPEHWHYAGIDKTINGYLPGDKLSFLTIKKILLTLYGAYILIWILLITWMKSKKYLLMVGSMLVSVCICTIYFRYIHDQGINFIIFPWFMHSITMMILEKDNRKMLVITIILGMCHAFSFMTSNTHGYAINVALYVPALFGIMCTVNEIANTANETKTLRFAAIGSLVIYTGLMLFLRCYDVYFQQPVYKLTEVCEVGPAKGIYLSADDKKYITDLTTDVREKISDDNRNTLLFTTKTFVYLCVDKKISQFSVWLSGVDEYTVDRLRMYYTFHPDLYPDEIYITKKDCAVNNVKAWAENNNYSVVENEISWYLVR